MLTSVNINKESSLQVCLGPSRKTSQKRKVAFEVILKRWELVSQDRVSHAG
jgi:hypothetical protein